MSRPDVLNRAVLALFGMTLLVIGGYGIARSFEAFGTSAAHDPVIPTYVAHFVQHNGDWFWPAIAVGALLLALAGASWLRAQLPIRQPAGDLDLSSEPPAGPTVLASSTVARAVDTELESQPGINHATARVLHDGRSPRLLLDLDIDDDLRPQDLRDTLQAHVLPRVARTLEVESVEAEVRLNLAESRRTVV